VPIAAERDALEGELSADPLHDDLIIDVVEDNVLVQANRGEQELVQGGEPYTFHARLVPLLELEDLPRCLDIVQSHK